MDDTLLQALQKRLAKPVDPAVVQPSQDQITTGLQSRTGKLLGDTSGPQVGTVGEQAGVAAGQAAVKQQNLAGQTASDSLSQRVAALANQQKTADTRLAAANTTAQTQMATQGALAGQQRQAGVDLTAQKLGAAETAKIADLNAKASQTLSTLASERGVQTADIFQGFQQGNADLSQRKDAAQLEQLGFNMALQDKAYMYQINAIGQERQLTDHLAFQSEATRLIVGDEMDRTLADIGFKEAMGADQRTFISAMSAMNLDQALAVSRAAIAQANAQAMISGATTAGVAVANPVGKMVTGDDGLKTNSKGDFVDSNGDAITSKTGDMTTGADAAEGSSSIASVAMVG